MKKKKPGPVKGTKFSDVKRSAVGERLFKTRRIRGLSQEELGKKVKLSKRMIAHYESAEGNPTITILKQLADALGVTVSYLTGESAQKTIGEELSPKIRHHLEQFHKLSPREQKIVMKMIEGLSTKDNEEPLNDEI